jgi:hypothetical protein
MMTSKRSTVFPFHLPSRQGHLATRYSMLAALSATSLEDPKSAESPRTFAGSYRVASS